MAGWMKRAWKAFVSQAHALGAVYYTWAILSGLVTAAYTGYKQLSTPQLQGGSEWLFYAFAAGLILVALVLPILGAAIIKTATRANDLKVANPTLAINKRAVTYEIAPTSINKRQTLTLEALEETPSFRFHLGLTGIATHTITLNSPGVTLLGPVQRGGADSYEVRFDNPLQKGQVTTISLDVKVDDPQRTMRCFLSDRFHNAARYGSFEAKYVFQPRPSSITRERQTIAGETIESSNQLHWRNTAAGAEYDFSVAKVDADCAYTVSWIW